MFKLSKSKHLNLAKIYKETKNLFNEIPLVKKRRRRRRIFKFLKYFSISIIIVCAAFIIIFATSFLNLKQVYQEAIAGKNNLEKAVNFTRQQDFKEALVFSKLASSNFNISINKLQEVKSSFFISRIPFIKFQLNNVEYLLATAEILSRAVKQGVDLGQQLENLLEGNKKLSFSKFSKEEKRKILGRLYESTPELSGMKASLDLALVNLERIHYFGILWPLENKIMDLKEKIVKVREILVKAMPMSEILPPLVGYPGKANYLVILQNSDELRPTGGFIGTYGIMELEYGEILRFDTHDIYHLDMPIKDKLNIEPPQPLKKYLGINKWYMRDANWSPDWPTSAKKIEWFYKNKNKLLANPDKADNFTGIIAITPKLILDLIKLTGPIVIDGEEYNGNNFVDLLQYRVEKGYIQLGVPSWHRKEIIGEIAKKLKIKLFDLPSSRWHEVIEVINDNMVKKNILFYIKNPELENSIKELGHGGNLKDTAGDYLMVVDANLASLKTDAVMSRSINYKVSQSYNSLIAKLRINYSHNGDFDWKTTRYRTYTRVYAPLGSQLIKAEGLTEGEVIIQNELGKTSFSAFLLVEPGQINSLYFEYKLPDNLHKLAGSSQYELYIQKQPGSEVGELTVDLDFNNEVKSYNPTGFYVNKANDSHIIWESSLEMDRVFSLNF